MAETRGNCPHWPPYPFDTGSWLRGVEVKLINNLRCLRFELLLCSHPLQHKTSSDTTGGGTKQARLRGVRWSLE